jgi:ubiquinone/menaquinone biosynthesis C-methylase UbiE
MESIQQLTPAEKQLISTLGWFRSRYALFLGLDLQRKANKENIEFFGSKWMGDFKEDWNLAYHSLQTKGIIGWIEEEFCFTKQGDILKEELERIEPFYQYEYDTYFHHESQSKAHSAFCEQVYGMDLSQHGLIDQQELTILLDRLNLLQPDWVLDLGCGNGKITEWLSSKINSNFEGIDISPQAIFQANQRCANVSNLNFKVGNLNQLNLDQKYDAILFLDTLYYANNLIDTLKQTTSFLNEGGKIFAYFSQWIMEEQYYENLLPNNTHLAKALHSLGLSFHTVDLTLSGINHWKKKLKILIELKSTFEAESNSDLWDYRYREANRYANWGDDKYARYFYEIYKG